MARISIRGRCLTCGKVRVFPFDAYTRVECGDYLTNAAPCPFCKDTGVEVVQA